MEEGEGKKGFTIKDRRISSQPEGTAKGGGEKAERKAEGLGGEPIGRPEAETLLEMDFSAFIFSLGTSALFHLGEVPDPGTQKREKNLPLAKQTIDILAMLKEKTRGNLTPDEEKLIEHLLTDLRWRYVREAKE